MTKGCISWKSPGIQPFRFYIPGSSIGILGLSGVSLRSLKYITSLRGLNFQHELRGLNFQHVIARREVPTRHCEERNTLRHCKQCNTLRHCEERSDVAISPWQSPHGNKSVRSALTESINLSFLNRLQDLICFSRSIA